MQKILTNLSKNHFRNKKVRKLIETQLTQKNLSKFSQPPAYKKKTIESL